MQRKTILYLLAVLVPLISLLPLGVAAQGTGPSPGGDPPDVIDPTASAFQIAQAIARDPSILTGASFVTQPPTTNSANAVSDTPLTLFPIYGTSYGILTSGAAVQADQPGTFSSTDLGGNPVRGDTDYDVTILKIDLDVPTGVNCLSIDFQFLSEEFPIYVGTAYNDGFIAELDTSTWTTSGSVISAPNNFAFDPNGNVVSVNSTGVTQMSPSNGIGTAYDSGLPGGGDTNGAATVLLRAKTPISAGPHSLYLSIFDQGDQVLDSAVFLDNLLVGLVGPNLCVPGAGVETEIEMHKTVGTDPDVCAPTDDITVEAGTVVYYCYTVENSGNVTLNLHDLADSELGPLFAGLDYPLAPGDSVNTVDAGVTASATINGTTINTATWTAYNDGPIDLVRSTDTATVTLETPAAVTLASFDAVAQTDHVLVSWETVSELDNAGFTLYRSTTEGGERTLLAFVPSQAPGGTGGAAYAYTDAAVASGETTWYWLEALDLSGATTVHGPVSATLQTPTAVTLATLDTASNSPLPIPAGLPLGVLPAAASLALGATYALRRRGK